MMPHFFIMGKEGLSVDAIYHALTENEVDLVVDIRLKRGPEDMEHSLERCGDRHGKYVDYVWMKVFANPFEGREDWAESYDAYLIGMDIQLEELYDVLMRSRCCIITDQRDINASHRVMLADRMKKKYGLTYADITVAAELVKKYGIKNGGEYEP